MQRLFIRYARTHGAAMVREGDGLWRPVNDRVRIW